MTQKPVEVISEHVESKFSWGGMPPDPPSFASAPHICMPPCFKMLLAKTLYIYIYIYIYMDSAMDCAFLNCELWAHAVSLLSMCPHSQSDCGKKAKLHK